MTRDERRALLAIPVVTGVSFFRVYVVREPTPQEQQQIKAIAGNVPIVVTGAFRVF